MLIAFGVLAFVILCAVGAAGAIFIVAALDRESPPAPPRLALVSPEAIDAAEARSRARKGADDRDLERSRASAGRFSR